MGHGLSAGIKSIDIVQQMPSTPGTMSHWWVFVNRPDSLVLGTTPKTVTYAGEWKGFDMVGGFVVDIWGALWNEQQRDPVGWCDEAAPSNRNAVRDAPFIDIEDMDRERARVHIRHVYP